MKNFIKEWIEQNKKMIERGEEWIVDQQKEIKKAKKRIKILEQLDKAIVDIKVNK